MVQIKLLSQIFIAFFIYFIVVHFYLGIITLPTEGDSLAYHIPIANAFVAGGIFAPELIPGNPFLRYSPASSEFLLSFLILFGIPLNIYNVFAVICLYFVAKFAGRRVGLSWAFSIIFAVTICSLNGIARWLNTQIIDIWLLVFFLLSLGLLEKPQKSIRYFLVLGLSIGMLCGTKFTGPVFAGVLFVTYIKELVPIINIKRIFAFLIPFAIFGLTWYVRNYLLMGNPIYPQPLLSLPGGGSGEFTILNTQVWKILTTYPVGFVYTLNAYIAEYGIWTLALFVCFLYMLYSGYKRKMPDPTVVRISIIGFLIFIVYLFLPSSMEEHIAVSVFRYSYSAFVLFILCVFLIAQKYKKVVLLSLIALSNIFIIGFPLFYYPKLVFIYIPLTLGLIYFRKIKEYIFSAIKLKE